MKRTLLVIPAYNEEENIKRVVDNIITNYNNVDYIIINDASTDHTSAICNENHYSMIELPINTGLGVVVQTGFKYALRHDYDFVVQFDGDGQHNPEYIQDLVNKADEGYQIVFGSRFVNKKRSLKLRELGSTLISAAFQLTTGVKITDPTSGFKCYDREAIRYYATHLHAIPEADDIVYLIKKKGFKIADVPVEMNDRIAGESYFNPIKSIKFMVNILLSILLLQNFRKK